MTLLILFLSSKVHHSVPKIRVQSLVNDYFISTAHLVYKPTRPKHSARSLNDTSLIFSGEVKSSFIKMQKNILKN